MQESPSQISMANCPRETELLGKLAKNWPDHIFDEAKRSHNSYDLLGASGKGVRA